MRRRGIFGFIGLVAVCASIAAGGVRIIALAQSLRTLAPMRYGERRAALAGPYYPEVARLQRQLPPGSLDLVLRGPREIDTAIFANYYLYPRIRSFYRNLDLWRAKRRDPREMLLWMDASVSAAPRRVSYLVARAENGQGKIEPGALRSSAILGLRPVIIPLVCSIDGAPPDEYVVPVSFENDGSNDAEVTLSYHDRDGWFDRRQIRLSPKQRVFKDDVLVDVFGKMGIGWISIECDQPVRVAASLLNRGPKKASPLLVATPEAAGTVTSENLQFDGPAAKLFLINPREGWATVDIDATARSGRLSTRIQLAPYELRLIPDPGTSITGTPCRDCAWRVRYLADRDIFVYASREDGTGTTHFAWSEAAR